MADRKACAASVDSRNTGIWPVLRSMNPMNGTENSEDLPRIRGGRPLLYCQCAYTTGSMIELWLTAAMKPPRFGRCSQPRQSGLTSAVVTGFTSTAAKRYQKP